MVESTLMSGDSVIFWLTGEYHPNPPIMENIVAPKFFKPIRMLDCFTKSFSRMLLSFEFIFVWQFRIMTETYITRFGYWWLLQFFKRVSLKVKLLFLHIFKFVSASCLDQFTLYVIYYIFYIYNLHYVLYYSVVF